MWRVCIGDQPHLIHWEIIFKIFLGCSVEDELEMNKNRGRKTTEEAVTKYFLPRFSCELRTNMAA